MSEAERIGTSLLCAFIFYVLYRTVTEKGFLKDFYLNFKDFFMGTFAIIFTLLKIICVLLIVGLIIWAIVAFPIAAIIILLILILLK